MNAPERPLVSFVLLSYNQEDFIIESVRSALEQTYQPLEIILSDDCSQDNTLEMIKREVGAYEGPHTIRINHSNSNRGLVRNLESAVQVSRGELIVVQAGDDCSDPRRTELLVAAWEASNRADLVCSDVILIDERGQLMREGWSRPLAYPQSLDEAVKADRYCSVLGCAAAYSRSLFEYFPAMSESVFQEDNVLMFRALLGRGVCTIPEMLVKYRQHSGNLFLTPAGAQMPGDVGNESVRQEELLRLSSFRYLNNLWGIARDRLIAWDQRRYPADARRTELARSERYWWYRTACLDAGFIRACVLAAKAIGAGVPIRSAIGLINMNLSLRSDGRKPSSRPS